MKRPYGTTILIMKKIYEFQLLEKLTKSCTVQAKTFKAKNQKTDLTNPIWLQYSLQCNHLIKITCKLR